MKTPVLRYLLLIALCGAVLFFLFRDHIPFGRDNSDFAVPASSVITGIDLVQGDRKVTLRKTENDWTLNKSGDVRKAQVLTLVKILKEIKIKSPVSGDVFDNEVVKKKADAVRVVVYHNHRPLKSFFVYHTSSNNFGNIMKMKVNSKPYIVYVPGYEDNIGSFFSADELYWMPYIVFRTVPSQIRSVAFENHIEPSASFVIERSGSGPYFHLQGILHGVDSVRVWRYVSYFTAVSFESRPDTLSAGFIRGIEQAEPAYTITLSKTDGKTEILRIWERMKDGKNGEKDTDRVWAEKNDVSGIFVMRYFDLDPILKKRSWFTGG